MSSITSSKSFNPYNYRVKESGKYNLLANQTTNIAANDPIKINSVESGNVAFNSATYTWTLKANKKYRLEGQVDATLSSAAGYCYIVFRKVSGAENIGTQGLALAATWAGHISQPNTAVAEITPTVDTDVRLVIRAVANLTSINTPNSFVTIQELDTYTPSTQKWDYAYVSPEVDLSVIGIDWTTLYAKGQFFKTNNGRWLLDFHIKGTVTSASRTSYTIEINNVIFQSTSSEAIIGMALHAAASLSYSIASYNSNTLVCHHSSATTTLYGYSGRVLLASKPTGYAIPADI